MQRRRRSVIPAILLLALSVLACGGLGLGGGEESAPPDIVPEEPSPPDIAPEEVPTEAPAIDLTGTWNSPEWGEMTLVQNGNEVSGVYVYNDGQIEGTLEGNELNYRWWELAPNQPYEVVTDPQFYGDGYFVVSPDGNHIEGEWAFGSSLDWDGVWTADRQ